MKLTVYHDGQYWVGVLEELVGKKLRAVRYLFGSEPYDYDVLSFVNKQMLSYISQANANIEVKVPVRPSNPKRLEREAAKETSKVGISTFAQEAIKKDYATRKSGQLIVSKQRRKELDMHKRVIKIQKAKEKKRGH